MIRNPKKNVYRGFLEKKKELCFSQKIRFVCAQVELHQNYVNATQ